jgi:hypothetical protein
LNADGELYWSKDGLLKKAAFGKEVWKLKELSKVSQVESKPERFVLQFPSSALTLAHDDVKSTLNIVKEFEILIAMIALDTNFIEKALN